VGQEANILKGMYRLRQSAFAPKDAKLRAQLLGSGTILREVMAAADLLEKDFGIAADIWSCTSMTELRRDGLAAERFNLLHPLEGAKKPHVEQCLEGTVGPVIASTDYMKAFADGIRPFMPKGRTYKALGTDGFGRSDTRAKLRHFFEVDRYWIVLATLKALAEDGVAKKEAVAEAIKKYSLDPAKADPTTV
jgi:pyruvate dehydrogenase E1 component